MKKPEPSNRGTQLVAVLVASGMLLLGGCASKDNQPVEGGAPSTEKEATTPAEKPTTDDVAVAIIDGSTYDFTLTTCLYSDEDVVASGPGRGADGELAWFDLDISKLDETWTGGSQMTLGTDQQFDETDRSYMFYPDDVGSSFTVVPTANGVQVLFEGTGLAEDGSNKGVAQVRIACGDGVLAEAAAQPEVAAASGNGAGVEQCLLGEWTADNEFFLATLEEFGTEAQSVTGAVVMEFSADGTTRTDYRDWTITAHTEGVSMQIVRTGVDTGAYVVSGDTISLRDAAIGSSLSVGGGGIDMELEPSPVDYVGAKVNCGPNLASITTGDGTLKLSR